MRDARQRDLARKAHAILVLLGAAWVDEQSRLPALAENVTLERVEHTIAELREHVTAPSSYSETGGLRVLRDSEDDNRRVLVLNLGYLDDMR